MEELFHLFKSDVGILETLGYSVAGLLVVFLMLVILMFVIKIMGRLTEKAEKPEPVNTAQAETQPEPAVPAAPLAEAPGSAGEVMLHDVPERTAAIIMAIVADQMGKPLNELRFISIREVKEDEV